MSFSLQTTTHPSLLLQTRVWSKKVIAVYVCATAHTSRHLGSKAAQVRVGLTCYTTNAAQLNQVVVFSPGHG
jgi:mRNA-degrading endonuclease toxin of MazEF toxin-antitoxin module